MIEGTPHLDLGFYTYLKHKDIGNVREDSCVEYIEGKGFPEVSTEHALLYTCRADLLDAADGDTLTVLIEMGFGIRQKQILRLRGINAESPQTAKGKRARDYVTAKLKGASVVVKTFKRDMYRRFTADVFYGNKSNYLNRELLEEGLAERYGNY